MRAALVAGRVASRSGPLRASGARFVAAALSAASRPLVTSDAGAGFRRHGGLGGLIRPRQLSAAASETEETMEFQAETRQLLDIVTHSLYTDKEVFLRELISNASDAMEKLRHLQVSGEKVTDEALPLEINITTNSEDRTLTIQDAGIGMSREDLVKNLGTIARSGSKAFVQELKEVGAEAGADAAAGIIGQFGVGFYSAFMVGDKVTVISKSARAEEGSGGAVWSSDGTGRFSVRELAPEDEATRGARVVIQLREGCDEYATKERVIHVIKKYSNFVGVPIKVDGEVVNTVEALWMRSPNEVEESKYDDFYRFIAHAYDAPLGRLHFRADAPIDLRALFFIPSGHDEKFGMGRMEPGVSLYSRKVLIEAKCPDILPEWLRFVKGVVDSEDLPLSISREKPQDTALLRKIGDVLTRKILRFLQDMQKKEPEKYKNQFFKEFGFFLKEGVCQDYARQPDIAKLLYFESSRNAVGELTSLDEYISRLAPEHNEIYYLCAPTRTLAEASPYYEAFRKSGREVLFVYNPIDDFVMNNLKNYAGRPLLTAEKENLDLGDAVLDEEKDEKEGEDSSEEAAAALSDSEAQELTEWLKNTALPDRVMEVRTTARLVDSPAIVSSGESGALRRMMRAVEQANTGEATAMPRQKLEINPRHPIVVGLHRLQNSRPDLAQMIAEQLFDNALVAAGLMDDGRVMLPRLNALMQKAIQGSEGGAAAAKPAASGVAGSGSSEA